MNTKIVYTYEARQDLRDIYAYIAFKLLVPETAVKFIDKILEGARSLETLPKRNPLYREEPWHSKGVYFLPVHNYLVFYTVDDKTNTVSVIRIMYARRDVTRQIEQTSERKDERY